MASPFSFTPSNSTGRPAPLRPTLAYFAFHFIPSLPSGVVPVRA